MPSSVEAIRKNLEDTPIEGTMWTPPAPSEDGSERFMDATQTDDGDRAASDVDNLVSTIEGVWKSEPVRRMRSDVTSFVKNRPFAAAGLAFVGYRLVRRMFK